MRILLMDDEEQVRVVTTRILEFLGHDVTTAVDGQKAVEIFRMAMEKKQEFDLVILDIVVNDGIGGKEALKAIKDFAPGVLAIASSGYSDRGSIDAYKRDGFMWFLPKPVAMEVLQATLLEIQRFKNSSR